MTAFARNEISTDDIVVTLELRSVNHRYLDISIRAPEEIRTLEQKIRTNLAQQLSRGKVELSIRSNLNTVAKEISSIQLNMPLVQQLAKASEDIATKLSNADKINPLDILRWPGVIDAPEVNAKDLQATVLTCLGKILTEFVEARKVEGNKLAAMLLERCDSMEKIINDVEKIIPQILEIRREKILTRLAELDLELDDKRIEQEIVLLAQKMDVTEETDRLGAHLSEVRRVLKQNKPVGRRLDFLMQELNREANTLGSKSIDVTTTKASVDLKVLIEQMREQVQNIE